MQTKLKVTGMSCMHCVDAVKQALEAIPGVEAADVSLEPAQAVVTGDANATVLVEAIKAEGYDAETTD